MDHQLDEFINLEIWPPIQITPFQKKVLRPHQVPFFLLFSFLQEKCLRSRPIVNKTSRKDEKNGMTHFLNEHTVRAGSWPTLITGCTLDKPCHIESSFSWDTEGGSMRCLVKPAVVVLFPLSECVPLYALGLCDWDGSRPIAALCIIYPQAPQHQYNPPHPHHHHHHHTELSSDSLS